MDPWIMSPAFKERLELMKLMIELRQLQPWGIVGVLETRNMFANLFSEFETVRDPELDALIGRLAEAMREDDEATAARLDELEEEGEADLFDPANFLRDES